MTRKQLDPHLATALLRAYESLVRLQTHWTVTERTVPPTTEPCIIQTNYQDCQALRICVSESGPRHTASLHILGAYLDF